MKKQGKDEHGKPLEKRDMAETQPDPSSSSSNAPAAPPVTTPMIVVSAKEGDQESGYDIPI